MATGNARLEEVELELIARQKLRRHEIGLAQKAGTFDRAKYAKEMLAHYDALDRVLASKGWHSTSPWFHGSSLAAATSGPITQQESCQV